ncbi:hypothetical protein NC652_009790 [Populus alba x Populus x berolinensis]|nr:hypothetical protein NC652_009790 [Populus alba x Populus x berolinensis]
MPGCWRLRSFPVHSRLFIVEDDLIQFEDKKCCS